MILSGPEVLDAAESTQGGGTKATDRRERDLVVLCRFGLLRSESTQEVPNATDLGNGTW